MSGYSDGTYRVVLGSHQLGKTKNNNPQIVFSFTPQAKLVGGKEEPLDVQWERSIFRVLNANTIDWAVEDLKNLGYPHSTFDQLDPTHAQAYSFVGVEATARCEHEMYEGKNRERWSFSFGGGAPKVEAIDRKDVAQLNALFGSKLKRVGQGTPPVRPTSPPPSNQAAAAAVEERI